MRKIYSLIIGATLLLLQSCSKDATLVDTQPDAENYSSKVATDWMELYRQTVKTESKNPAQASRIYAYAGIGLYESVIPGMSGYKSLQGQVPGLNLPDYTKFGEIDYINAVNESLYQIGISIFGSLKPQDLQAIETLHDKYYNESFKRIPDDIRANSKSFGVAIAQAVLDRANNDNFAATRNMTYTVPSSSINPAWWSPTGAVTNPLEPYWGTLKSFSMANNAACTVPSAITFDATPGSAFYNQANEVLQTNLNLTQAQKDIALWWADNAGTTPTPPGHWVGIQIVIAQQKGLSLKKTAEMFALTNIAMADAFISCWNEKYQLNLLRPQTYIRNYIPGYSSWTPLIPTPPFPEYPSGHSVASSAAADVLKNVFNGDFPFTDNSNVSLGLAPRSFSSLDEAANEAAISRLYGGIHYREAIENGLRQGREVSKAVFQNIHLRGR